MNKNYKAAYLNYYHTQKKLPIVAGILQLFVEVHKAVSLSSTEATRRENLLLIPETAGTVRVVLGFELLFIIYVQIKILEFR